MHACMYVSSTWKLRRRRARGFLVNSASCGGNFSWCTCDCLLLIQKVFWPGVQMCLCRRYPLCVCCHDGGARIMRTLARMKAITFVHVHVVLTYVCVVCSDNDEHRWSVDQHTPMWGLHVLQTLIISLQSSREKSTRWPYTRQILMWRFCAAWKPFHDAHYVVIVTTCWHEDLSHRFSSIPLPFSLSDVSDCSNIHTSTCLIRNFFYETRISMMLTKNNVAG